MKTERLYTVYDILHDIDGDGPACDGTIVRRFRDKGDAAQFAASATCYGNPAKVTEARVPKRLAQRWGCA